MYFAPVSTYQYDIIPLNEGFIGVHFFTQWQVIRHTRKQSNKHNYWYLIRDSLRTLANSRWLLIDTWCSVISWLLTNHKCFQKGFNFATSRGTEWKANKINRLRLDMNWVVSSSIEWLSVFLLVRLTVHDAVLVLTWITKNRWHFDNQNFNSFI